MKKALFGATLLSLLLAACSSTGGSSEMYGEIKGGVQTTHQH